MNQKGSQIAYVRQAFIISDLHIGGADLLSGPAGSRGFRMITHTDDLARYISLLGDRPTNGPEIELVINGDFVDFLAESVADHPPQWVPFRAESSDAAATFRTIAQRDAPIFQALSRLLHAGHSLTILLGNHDIELSFPAVRRALEEILAVQGHHRLRFLYDNEAYQVGDALIEHGNRYDIYNWIDHDQLREVRSIQSRGQRPKDMGVDFTAAPGSRLVAEVMNPLKVRFPFVDLLKPEREAVLPLLRALQGGYRNQIGEIARAAQALAPIVLRRMKTPTLPSDRGAIAARTDLGGPGGTSTNFGSPEVAAFFARFGRLDESAVRRGDIAATSKTDAGHPAHPAEQDEVLKKRLPELLEALRILKDDMTFNDEVETVPSYLHAAEELSRSGNFRYVIFGHTHLAKRVALSTGAVYFNTGTWCDLMKVPSGIFAGTPEAMAELERFVNAVKGTDLKEWIFYRPTFVRLCLGADDKVAKADLLDFSKSSPFDGL